jgi:CRP-like cAMP-binding protein
MNHVDLARRLGATPLFSRLSQAQLQTLLASSPEHQAGAGNSIADAANGLKHHLVLLAGALQAQRRWLNAQGREQSHGWPVVVTPDGPGFALLNASSGHITVDVMADARYLLIDRDELDELVDWSQRPEHLALARGQKVFQEIPRENVQLAFERMRERAVEADEAVITQGEPGDAYYIMVSGQAEVWVTDPLSDETKMVAVLSDNDAFGEEALLLGGTRTATVRMITPGRLLVLDKVDFDELVKPGMVNQISAEQAHAMLQSGQAKLLDCRYDMEFEESRIPGAQLVSLGSLRREGVFTVDPSHTYIVYCRGGKRSLAATFLLHERGIRAISLAGGIQNWPFEIDETPL